MDQVFEQKILNIFVVPYVFSRSARVPKSDTGTQLGRE